MSEAYRRSEESRGEPWAQGSEPRRAPGRRLGIDPGQAAEFRRRLDYQGSAELIPTAGPDAAADQGPAIKAVWEPHPVEPPADALGARRRDRRPPGRPHHSAAPQVRADQPRAGQSRIDQSRAKGAARRKKRTLVVGSATAAAVAVGALGFMTFKGGGGTPAKASSANVIPISSPGATSTGRAANSTIGTSLSVTASPSRSATPSHSPTPSATQSKDATDAATPSTTGAASRTPTPRASPTKPTCFLFICG